MLAPKAVQAEKKASDDQTDQLALGRPTFEMRSLGGAVDQRHMFQRAIGNQAALRRRLQPSSSPDAEEVGDFAPHGTNRPRAPSPPTACRMPPFMQPKLLVGRVDDPLEHEAETVAEQVMRMADPGIAMTASPLRIGRQCAACEEEDKLQTKRRDGSADVGGGEAPAVVDDVLDSPGRPLDTATRAFFEPRFGADFSAVQVHTDANAATSARSVGASAYVVGRHMVFSGGSFAPDTSDGRRLIAHELAHVVQQGGSSGRAVRRMGDPKQIPLMLPCSVPPSAAPPATDFVLFPNLGATLTAALKTRIGAFVDNWNAVGKGASVRVDGFASDPGAERLNWQLSCDRATAVRDELMKPSASAGAGIPERSLDLYMHGKTTEFGDEAQNRRVSLFLPPSPPSQQPPTPDPPKPPTQPATEAPKSGTTSDCDATQSGLVTSAIKTAQSNIAAVIPPLAANPLTTDMQNALWIYFRDSSPGTAATVSANLTKIAAKLSGLTYECETDCVQDELGYTRIGTAVTGIGNIHLCMNNLKPDANEIANTIIHEVAHYTLLANDSAGYYGNDCSESDTTATAGSRTKLALADSYNCFVRNWLTETAASRADVKGDLTGANIAGIVQSPPGPIDLSAPRRKPIFTIKLTRGSLAMITGVKYRWVLRDPQGRSYRMTDSDGNDLFDFKPAVESVLAAINTPTRDLLKQQGVSSGTVICRAISPLFGDKLFELPVTFGSP